MFIPLKQLTMGGCPACWVSLALALVATVEVWQAAQFECQEDQKATTICQDNPKDLFGDPLPIGAIARVGSSRLLHYGAGSVAFSADGNTIITIGDDGTVRFWNALSGKLKQSTKLCSSPTPRQNLGLWSNGDKAVGFNGDSLVTWETSSGKELKRLVGAQRQAPSRVARFSLNGTCAIAALGQCVTISDCEKGTLRHLTLGFDEYTANQKGEWEPLCISPDGNLLAVKQLTGQALTIWHVAKGNRLARINVKATIAAFSPRNNVLAAVCDSDGGCDQCASLHLFDLKNAAQLYQVPLSGGVPFSCIGFSPDGKVIAVANVNGVALRNSGNGCELRRLTGTHTRPLTTFCFSPAGNLLAGVDSAQVHIWETASGKEVHELPTPNEPPDQVAMSPKGELCATASAGEGAVTLWEGATGQLIHKWFVESARSSIVALFFTPDAKTLIVGQSNGSVISLDIKKGAISRRRQFTDKHRLYGEQSRFIYFHVMSDEVHAFTLEQISGHKQRLRACVWTPDFGSYLMGGRADSVTVLSTTCLPTASRLGCCAFGETIAFLTGEGIAIADLKRGLCTVRIPGQWRSLAASPDFTLLGAIAALPAGEGLGVKERAEKVEVFEALTCQRICSLAAGPVNHFAFGPDNQTLITIDRQGITLWDLASEMPIRHLTFPNELRLANGESLVATTIVAADATRALTALKDGTSLVWQVPLCREQAAPGTAKTHWEEANRPWADLASSDAKVAYTAMWRLVHMPASATAMLAKKLARNDKVENAKVRRLIRDLDDEDFFARERATQALAQMGLSVVPDLRLVQCEEKSPEVQARVEALLARLVSAPPSQDTIRRIRAISILERVGSKEAVSLLHELARGPSASMETQEAKRALERLRKP
jgi:WD40 repeat protein